MTKKFNSTQDSPHYKKILRASNTPSDHCLLELKKGRETTPTCFSHFIMMIWDGGEGCITIMLLAGPGKEIHQELVSTSSSKRKWPIQKH